jgi:hypothetical protein
MSDVVQNRPIEVVICHVIAQVRNVRNILVGDAIHVPTFRWPSIDA